MTILVSVLGRIVLGGHDQTSALPGAPVDSFNDVNQLLFILHGPVDLVVVTSAQINHDVLVAEKEHARARIVQLVHLIKIRNLANIHKIDYAEVFNLFSDGEEGLVHHHAGRVPVMTEPDQNNTILLR